MPHCCSQLNMPHCCRSSPVSAQHQRLARHGIGEPHVGQLGELPGLRLEGMDVRLGLRRSCRGNSSSTATTAPAGAPQDPEPPLQSLDQAHELAVHRGEVAGQAPAASSQQGRRSGVAAGGRRRGVIALQGDAATECIGGDRRSDVGGAGGLRG